MKVGVRRELSRVVMLAGAAAFAVGPPTGALPPEDVTVQVQCPQQSVQRALERKATRLTVEIDGTCNENVVISRSDVTLRGVGAGSGLNGVGADPGGDHAVLRVAGVSRVRVENLHVSNGSRFGLMIDGGQATVDDCQLLDNVRAGITVGTGGGQLVGTGIEISGSTQGLQVFEAGLALCDQCTISADDSALLVVSARGFVSNSTLNGGWGALVASSDATAGATSSALAGGEYAVWANLSAQANVTDSTMNGAVTSRRGSVVELAGSTQSVDPLGSTLVDTSSSLHAEDSELLGPLEVRRFSSATLDADSSVVGALVCSAGGNAHCSDPNDIGGTTTGCALCVKP